MKKLLRTIRFDDTDTRVYAHAAPAGEWAVPGGFAFAGLGHEQLVGKTRQAFANGFLGLGSFAHSTFATVGEVPDAALAATTQALAQHLLLHYGAPDPDAALDAARAEIAFSLDLCHNVPINTVFTVRRILTETGEMKEAFRTITPPADAPAHARVWTIEQEPGDGA